MQLCVTSDGDWDREGRIFLRLSAALRAARGAVNMVEYCSRLCVETRAVIQLLGHR